MEQNLLRAIIDSMANAFRNGVPAGLLPGSIQCLVYQSFLMELPVKMLAAAHFWYGFLRNDGILFMSLGI